MDDQTPPEQNVAPPTPTDKVIQMRQQGLSNNQIINTLQRDGYETTSIFNALSQADMKAGVETAPPTEMPPETQQMQPPTDQPATPQQPVQEMPPAQPATEPQQAYGATPTEMPPDMGQMPPQQPPPNPTAGPPTDYGNYEPQSGGSPLAGERERVEELAEAIIDEKWNEIVRSINKIVDWKERNEARITKIEQQISDLKDSFDKLHKGILGKIGEYDKNLTSVGTEIKAMEKVFQKVLPTLTENVSELSRITGGMKKKE